MFDKARLIAEIATKDKRLAAYAMLVRSMEDRLADASKKRDTHDEAVRTLQSEREANAMLTAENASLEKDAGRYRWLRHGDHDEEVIHITGFAKDRGVNNNAVWLLRNDDLDRAIDAAIASKVPAP